MLKLNNNQFGLLFILLAWFLFVVTFWRLLTPDEGLVGTLAMMFVTIGLTLMFEVDESGG